MIARTVSLLLLAVGLAALPASAAARKNSVTPAGWAVRPAGAEISVAKSTQGFQGPLGSALSPSGNKLLSVSSAATRVNSADLFDLRKRVRTGTVPYDSRKGIGEAVFYGVVFSPGGKRAWASGGGQNVVHVYDVGKTLRETGQIPTPYFPAGIAYSCGRHDRRGDPELCNGSDEDCDGSVDDGCPAGILPTQPTPGTTFAAASWIIRPSYMSRRMFAS